MHEPFLRRIVATTGLSNFAGAISGAVVVIYALRVLDLGTAAWGIVAVRLVGRRAGRRARRRAAGALGRRGPARSRCPMLASVPAAALTPLAAVAPVPPALLLIVGGVVWSFTVVVYNIAQVSFRQRVCPPPLLGRMNASVRFIVWGTMPIGGLVGGWLGTHLGVQPTLWVALVISGLATLPVVLSPLLRMRDLPDAPDVATSAATRDRVEEA